MDPVSIATSITALVEVASNVIRYLCNVKNASSEQKRLCNEVAIVSGLLTALDKPQEDMEAEDEGFKTFRALAGAGGAIDQCKESLEKLRSKTHNDKVSGIEKIGRHFTWHFGKDEINEALTNVERLKSSLDLALTNDVGILMQKMKVNSDVLTRDLSELKDDVRAQKIDQERQEVGNWLSPFDFSAVQQEIFHRSHAGTGKWLLESEKFQRWSSSHNDILWCPGIPGAGKTYLTAIIIDYLRRETSVEGRDAVLCLFCNFNEQANQTAYNFMGALLRQMVQASLTLSSGIKSIYNTRAKGRGPDFKTLADIFRMELARFSKTFIIIDALDEVSESADIRTVLLKELRSCPVNLLVTSRHNLTIKKQFSEAQRCDIIAADEDIRSYVSERIGQEDLLTRHIHSFPSFKDEIPTRIVGSAKGMFLLARFHMDQISTKTKPKHIGDALEQLPQELNDNYARTIDRLKSQGSDCWSLARKVLLWLSNAQGSLSIVALQEALAVESGMNSMGIRDLDDIESMISACAGLVILEEGKEMSAPRLVHYTLQEYLTENQAILSSNPHAEIARACLALLSFDDFSDKAPDCWPRRQHEEIIHSTEEFACSPYQLTCYAASFWGFHAQRAGEADVMNITLDFLSRPANVAYNLLVTMAAEPWVELCKRVLYEELSLGDPEFLKMLLVVKFGLEIVLVELLKTRTKPVEDALDPMISRVACDAAKRRHMGIVKLLLTQKNVDWDSRCIDGESLLMLLAGQDDEESLRTLLQTKRCSVNAVNDQGSTLQWAMRGGFTSNTRLLLEAGTKVKARDNYDRSIVFQAFMLLYEPWREMVDLWLEYKADINTHGWHGNTALHAASGPLLDIPAIKYLVSKGANPKLPNGLGKTPLDLAESVVEEGWGDPDAEDYLKRAAQIVSILREAGGKTAEEIRQPCISELDPCFSPQWLDRLKDIAEWHAIYDPGTPLIEIPENILPSW